MAKPTLIEEEHSIITVKDPVRFTTDANDFIDNVRRARHGQIALSAYAGACYSGLGDLEKDPECVLSDLLCDLHHWADEHNVNWRSALMRSQSSYVPEAMGDEE